MTEPYTNSTLPHKTKASSSSTFTARRSRYFLVPEVVPLRVLPMMAAGGPEIIHDFLTEPRFALIPKLIYFFLKNLLLESYCISLHSLARTHIPKNFFYFPAGIGDAASHHFCLECSAVGSSDRQLRNWFRILVCYVFHQHSNAWWFITWETQYHWNCPTLDSS